MRKLYKCSWCWQIVAFAVFFGYSGLAGADGYETNAASKGEVRFETSSTLHGVEGHAEEWSGKVEFNPLTGQAVVPFEIRVPIRSLSTSHKARDKAMLKMFEDKKFPDAVWKVESWSCLDYKAEKGGQCHATGTLSMHGNSIANEADVMLQLTSDGFEAKTAFDLTTNSFGLKPPSVLGVIRVAKLVKVFVQTQWKKTA